MTTRKKMIVARPIGKFVNGDQKGVMDSKRLMMLAENFAKYRREVPVYAMGDHVESLDERLPDGWVEGLEVNGLGELVADVKLHGNAVAYVLDDLIRGASIGTVQGKNPDGTAQGEVLQHLHLTNDPFIKGLNIAAAQIKGGESAELFFSALISEEADVADQSEEITRLKDEVAALKAMKADETLAAKMTSTAALLAEKVREVAELTASNENLKVDVERFKSPQAIDELQLQLKAEQRQNRASKVRRLVGEGVSDGQFSVALVGHPKSGWNHPSDELVLSWFKQSIFKDSFERLDVMLETMPKLQMRRTFGAGESHEDATATMSDEQKEFIRKQGQDPDRVLAAMKAKNVKEYSAATAAKE